MCPRILQPRYQLIPGLLKQIMKKGALFLPILSRQPIGFSSLFVPAHFPGLFHSYPYSKHSSPELKRQMDDTHIISIKRDASKPTNGYAKQPSRATKCVATLTLTSL